MHRICSIFRNCSVIIPEAQHIHSIPPFHCPLHCPLHCPTHCLERCFAYTDVRRYSTLYKPCTLATEKNQLLQFTIPCTFSSEASDRLRILQSSVIIPDIVHLELCHSALHLFQSSPVYPFQSAASVQYFAFFTLQLPQTQTLQQLEVFGALSGSAHPILNNY